MKTSVIRKVERLIQRRLDLSLPAGIVGKIMDDMRDSGYLAARADRVDMLVVEACLLIAEETGIYPRQHELGLRLHKLVGAAEAADALYEKKVRANKILVALDGSLGCDDYNKALAMIANVVFSTCGQPMDPDRPSDPRPLKTSDVCDRCHVDKPASIMFLTNKVTDTLVATSHRAWAVIEFIEERLSDRMYAIISGELLDALDGVTPSVRVDHVVHTGRCQVESHDNNGQGHAKVDGILARVNFGGGVEVRREFSTREYVGGC